MASSNFIAFSSDELKAEVNPLGAQLSTLRDAHGRDLLWDGDPAIWNGRAPILFPIVGALAGGSYRLGNATYPMSRHGFARGKSFDLLESSSDSASFRLTSDSSTLKVYPFRFELDTLFKLKGAELSVTATVRNLGDEALPASVGFHPALRWPLPFGKPRAAHFIEFSNEEPAPIRRLDAQGLLTPTPCSSPVHGRRLALDDALFVEDVVIFDRLRSRAVTYGAGDGPRIRMSFADAAFLGIWTKPKAPFICIEPWRGVADPQGFSGDFRDKPGVFELARGESTSLTMTIALLSA